MSDPTWITRREAARWFLRGATWRVAGPVALLVGTVLSAVNQGAILVAGHGDGWTGLRVAINYAVPYCVASFGFLSGRRAAPTGNGDDGSASPGSHDII